MEGARRAVVVVEQAPHTPATTSKANVIPGHLRRISHFRLGGRLVDPVALNPGPNTSTKYDEQQKQKVHRNLDLQIAWKDRPRSLPVGGMAQAVRRRACLQIASAPEVPICAAVSNTPDVVLAWRSAPGWTCDDSGWRLGGWHVPQLPIRCCIGHSNGEDAASSWEFIVPVGACRR